MWGSTARAARRDLREIDLVADTAGISEVPPCPPPTADDRAAADLLHLVRKETTELNEWFTRSGFQTITLCGVAIGGIIGFMFESPALGLVAWPVLPVIFSVTRLGIYKYGVANRFYGYELYLDRTRNIPTECCGRWKDEYRKIGWVEAIRASHIVHATLFDAIYRKSWLLRVERPRSAFIAGPKNPQWFSQKSLFGQMPAKWHAGAFLKGIVRTLHFTAFAALLLLWVTFIVCLCQSFTQGEPTAGLAFHVAPFKGGVTGVASYVYSLHEAGVGVPVFVSPLLRVAVTVIAFLLVLYATFYTFKKRAQDNARCRILEDGLQSIHSFSIEWQAVVMAHHAAIENSRRYGLTSPQLTALVSGLKGDEQKDAAAGNAEKYVAREQHRYARHPDAAGMTGYTFWLGQEAVSLARCAKDIHSWIATRALPKDMPTRA